MSGRRHGPRQASRPVVALLGSACLVLGVVPASAASPGAGSAPVASAADAPIVLAPDPDAFVACGEGPAFPVPALSGPQGAEMAGDGPALRLARAATTGEAGYVPRGGWIRVVDLPDLVMFATFLHLPRSAGGPLLQVTVRADEPGARDPEAWRIAEAGFCRPHAVMPEDIDALGWTLAGPLDREANAVTVLPAEPVCATTPLEDPVLVLTPAQVSITLGASAEAVACPSGASLPLTILLPEPLGARALLDGASDPPTLVAAAQDPAPAVAPPVAPETIRVDAAAVPTAVAGSHAVADRLGSLPELVPVTVIDELALDVRLVATEDVVLAGPPRLCLVGPFAAPDDAGLIDRCWGDPDPGAALAPRLARTAGGGRPMLRAGEPVELHATIARGDIRCDYPPGEWRLEVVLTPLADGHGWMDVPLPDVPLSVDATGLAPARQLGRPESRYCGMAIAQAPASPSPPS